MKVKTISRASEDYTRERSNDVRRVARNYNPELHPFEKAREYTRALNAVKLDRVFAKPFVGDLQGHSDGVYCLSKHPNQISTVFSGSCNGEVRVWDLTNRSLRWAIPHAHKGFVRGLCVNPYGESFISASEDKTVKMWNMRSYNGIEDEEEKEEGYLTSPIHTYLHKHALTSLDHHQQQPLFISGSTEGVVEVWDERRDEAMHSYQWTRDTVNTVRFNPVQVNVMASTSADRSIILYDIRGDTAIRKMVLDMRSNQLCWNPMEAFNFTVANEDHNCYTFDMRKLDRALCIHKDHVTAVMALDYSPTGREIVTGGYDRSVRIFGMNSGRSREIYHTKRMQRIFSVAWSLDNKYILSGSDETNVRIWKANASEKLGTLSSRERKQGQYNAELVNRFQHHPQIKKIHKQRHIPKAIRSATGRKIAVESSIKQKTENRRKHSRPGSVPFVSERKKNIVKVEK